MYDVLAQGQQLTLRLFRATSDVCSSSARVLLAALHYNFHCNREHMEYNFQEIALQLISQD